MSTFNKSNFKRLYLPGLLSTCLAATTAYAGVSAEEAATLGGDKLTPMGAERAANADGSIPEWTGGMTKPPAGYQEGQRMIDPFADEKPLFTITAKNYQEYQDFLAVGQIATLKRYPDTFSIPVYPSHRTGGYPDAVYESTKKNAADTTLVEGGYGVANWISGAPFPIPKEGVEAYWNHVLRYRCDCSIVRNYTTTPVQANGRFVPVVIEEKISFFSALPDNDNPNALFAFLQKITAPARLEGDVLLVHEYIDQKKKPRDAWVYNPGQRRVRRAPEIAYDGPGTGSDNLRTADDLDMMNGSPDRYDWKLVGKKEMFIPYNAYKLHNGDLKYKDVQHKGHLNPEHLRYEKHRVWVVEATLKKGARHIYAKRVLYIDEDTWQIAMVDVYDGRGELWRFHEGHAMVHYYVDVPWLATESQYDLIAGRYITIGLDNEMKGLQYKWFVKGLTTGSYTPAALRRSGR
jgi:hypothetical protein